MMSVDVVPGSTFIAGDRRALFSVQGFIRSTQSRYYDVAPDDDRFVMIRTAPDAGLGQIVVVEKFFEELLRRMPNYEVGETSHYVSAWARALYTLPISW